MKLHHYLLPILLPILIVVAVNEYSRPNLQSYHNTKYDAAGMNPRKANPHKCTWSDYYDTGYCKRNHSKLLHRYDQYIDPIYFGMIGLLHSSGNYAYANILYLVVLWPLLMYFLLIRILIIRKKLKNG